MNSTSNGGNRGYERIREHDFGDTRNEIVVDHEDEDEEEEDDDESESNSVLRNNWRNLSSPTWIPANIPSESGKSSGTEESEAESAAAAAVVARRVRFKTQAQVVEMNPADALYANLARLVRA